MAYLEEYADRVRIALRATESVIEKKMFGSLGFMVNGHLTIGVGDGADGSVLMVRIGKENEEDFLQDAGASISVMGKRTMHGYLDLTPSAVASEDDLQKWVDRAVSFVHTLPPK